MQPQQPVTPAQRPPPWANARQPQRQGQYRVSPGVYRNRPSPTSNAVGSAGNVSSLPASTNGMSLQPWMRKM